MHGGLFGVPWEEYLVAVGQMVLFKISNMINLF